MVRDSPKDRDEHKESSSSIVLADGTSYRMQYNSYGELARLTLPTGGVYGYKYSEAYNGGGSA